MEDITLRKPYIQYIELPVNLKRSEFKKLRKKGAGFKTCPVPEFLTKRIWVEKDAT